MALTTPVSAQPLELDRNIISNGGVDWENLFDVNGTDEPTQASTLPSGYSKSVFVRDFVPGASGPDYSTFATGSKDTLNITGGWDCSKSNNVNDKTDIVNAYAAAANENGDIIVYFAMERYSNEGTGNIGFWFLQDDHVGCSIDRGKTGNFTGNHKDGDILIVAEFTNGGSVTDIRAYRWNGGANGYLDTTPIASGSECQNGGGSQNLCAIVNNSQITGYGAGTGVPWLTETKQSGPTPSNNLDTSEFFEGKINLTKLNLLGCFSQYMAVTRSSTSLTATIFDYALGDFQLCGIKVSKTCSNPRLNSAQDHIIYDITGQVTNTGVGTVYNVAVNDSPQFDQGTLNLGSIDASGFKSYNGTMTVTLAENGRMDHVTATATSDVEGQNSVPDATADATCPQLQISPAVAVSKKCNTLIAADSGLVYAKVHFSGTVCNVGDSKLNNVSVVDTQDDGTKATILSGANLNAPADPNNPTVEEGACMDYSGEYTPTTAVDKDGNPTTVPHEVLFSDSVEANALDIFGDAVTPQSATATCPLCEDPAP
ncbi:MAG: hypothetical protein R3292_03600 [Alcanivorax sp.]|nr:hypothetical protein [Alcanivorax sp.]